MPRLDLPDNPFDDLGFLACWLGFHAGPWKSIMVNAHTGFLGGLVRRKGKVLLRRRVCSRCSNDSGWLA